MTASRRWAAMLFAANVLVLGLAVAWRSAHPPNHDEVHIVETGLRMLGSYGNPKNFLHASVMYDLMAAVHAGAFAVRGALGAGWDQARYLEWYLEHREWFLAGGRVIVLGFTAMLLLAVNRLGEALYGGRAGLLAMALLSFGVMLPLTGTALKEDLPASALATLCVVVLCEPGWRWSEPRRWAVAGVLAGIAVGTKYTVAPIALAAVFVAFGGRQQAPVRCLLRFSVAAFVAFVVVEPYLFIDFASVAYSAAWLRGQYLSPGVSRHMAPRYLLDYLPLGLGLLVTCASVPAMAMAWRSREPLARGIVAYLAVVAAVFLWTTSGQPRYSIALAPFLCVLVAGEVLRLPRLRAAGSAAVLLLALVLTWPANIISAKFIALISREDTRTLAQAWIEREVPSGSRVLVEGTVNMEPSYAPSLLAVDAWYAARQQDAATAGTTGRLLGASAALAARSLRPRYDLVHTAIHYGNDFETADYLVLSSDGSLPTEFHRIVRAEDPDVQAMLASRRAAQARIDEMFTRVASFVPHPPLRFDWFANPDFSRLWAAPLVEFAAWRLGPRIDVYRRVSAEPPRE